ncbi:hypothetical protein GCM10007366_24540 [Mammaliicoccus vitulinus]|nr:hypothetical protein GCM10007366_24540 [Mammaliicoccus vitulinus]
MIDNISFQQLIKNLEYLKMMQMCIHLNEVVDFSIKNDLSFIESHIKLTNYEIDIKEKNMIESMIKVAAFPFRKEVKDFYFSFQPNINQYQIIDFTSLKFIESKENIVFLRPSGIDKIHLAISIGITAAKKRTSTTVNINY